MSLEKPSRSLSVKAVCDGPSQGTIVLEKPDGEKALLYSWTGKEPEFRRRTKNIDYSSQIAQQLMIDISDH